MEHYFFAMYGKRFQRPLAWVLRTSAIGLSWLGSVHARAEPVVDPPVSNSEAQDLQAAASSRSVVSRAVAVRAEQTVSPEAVAKAEHLAATAIDAYRSGEGRRAIAMYLEAFELAPSADILFNIARVYELSIEDREQALSYYRRAAQHPDALPERVRKAERRVEQLESLPLEELSPRNWPLVSDESSADLEATPWGEGSVDDRAMASSRERSWAAWGFGLAGATGLGIGAAFGISALHHANRARDNCDGNACANQRGVDSTIRARDAATVATAAFASGGILIAVAGWLFWSEEASATEATAFTAASWTPVVTTGGASLQWEGRF